MGSGFRGASGYDQRLERDNEIAARVKGILDSWCENVEPRRAAKPPPFYRRRARGRRGAGRGVFLRADGRAGRRAVLRAMRRVGLGLGVAFA